MKGRERVFMRFKERSDLVWLEFKDTLTAFNGQKKSSFKGKGGVNRDISSLVFRFSCERENKKSLGGGYRRRRDDLSAFGSVAFGSGSQKSPGRFHSS